MKKLRRAILIAIGAVVVFGLVAPFLRADRLRPRIQAALEAALNRPVHITSPVHLSFFTGPGFTVDDVLIGDTPAAGAEPFAHVESLRARIRWTSLFTGKLAFSSLYLDSPSVNLVKIGSGGWNIQPLLDRSSGMNAAHPHNLPDIEIRDGRLNFKFDDTKSVFYISGADVDIYPNENGDVVIRFSGVPARTDRGSFGFGQLSARGMLRSTNGEDRLNLGIRMERTGILDIARLFNGRDMGIHGFVVANAHLEGPLSNIAITGDLNITDIHRWDLMPPRGEGWTLNYRGQLDMLAHRLDIETVVPEGQPEPVAIKLRLADYMTNPKWGANITFRDLPAASLVETARHMGAPFPAGVQVDGKVEGGIGYSNENGLQGQLALENAGMRFSQAVAAEFTSASVLIADGRMSFGPAEVRMENAQSAEIEASYAFDGSSTTLKIRARQLTIAEAESSAEHIVSASPIPLLEELRQGTWKGWIAFERHGDDPGIWSGEYDLQNAVVDIPGVAVPLRIQTASVVTNDSKIRLDRIRAKLGDTKLDGDYRYDPEAARPHRLRIHAQELQLADLEKLMLPTLRRNESFLARTFRLRKAAIPAWLLDRKAEGDVSVDRLLNGDTLAGVFHAHLVWDGASIALNNASCTLGEMRAAGEVAVDLTDRVPAYHLAGTIDNLDYRNGRLDVDGELDAGGIGSSLLLSVRSQGTFQGREIELSPETEVREITGEYRINSLAGIPRLTLNNLQVLQGGDTLTGQGASQTDGRIILDLTTGRKQVRLTGMLLPMRTEPVQAR